MCSFTSFELIRELKPGCTAVRKPAGYHCDNHYDMVPGYFWDISYRIFWGTLPCSLFLKLLIQYEILKLLVGQRDSKMSICPGLLMWNCSRSEGELGVRGGLTSRAYALLEVTFFCKNRLIYHRQLMLEENLHLWILNSTSFLRT